MIVSFSGVLDAMPIDRSDFTGSVVVVIARPDTKLLERRFNDIVEPLAIDLSSVLAVAEHHIQECGDRGLSHD